VEQWNTLQNLAGQRPSAKTRRGLASAYRTTGGYETRLIWRLIRWAGNPSRVRIYGILIRSDRGTLLPLSCASGSPSHAIATYLASAGFFTWDGRFTTRCIWREARRGIARGMLRIGLVHYNTMEEVERLLSALREFAARPQLP